MIGLDDGARFATGEIVRNPKSGSTIRWQHYFGFVGPIVRGESARSFSNHGRAGTLKLYRQKQTPEVNSWTIGHWGSQVCRSLS